MLLKDLGIEGACIFFSGFFDLLPRFRRATPPASPAKAAPPASRGVFAFEAKSLTFEEAPPTSGAFDAKEATCFRVLLTAPFEDRVRDFAARDRVLEPEDRLDPAAVRPFELDRRLVFAEPVFDEPFLLAEVRLLERPLDRPVEVCVFAIFPASLSVIRAGLPCQPQSANTR